MALPQGSEGSDSPPAPSGTRATHGLSPELRSGICRLDYTVSIAINWPRHAFYYGTPKEGKKGQRRKNAELRMKNAEVRMQNAEVKNFCILHSAFFILTSAFLPLLSLAPLQQCVQGFLE